MKARATGAVPVSAEESVIYAYEIHQRSDTCLVAAPKDRDWIDATDQKFAYRCLPLAIANQAGWVILNPAGRRITFKATIQAASRSLSIRRR